MVPFAQVYVMLQERRHQTTERDLDDGPDALSIPDTYSNIIVVSSWCSSLAKASPIGNKEEVRVLASP